MSVDVSNVSKEEQRRRILEAKESCYTNNTLYLSTPASSEPSVCPLRFDGAVCWPATPPDTLAVLPCPNYIYGFSLKDYHYASRYCTENGTWYESPSLGREWTNFTACISIETPAAAEIPKSHIWRLRVIYNVGYGTSLLALLIAVVIMASFRRLRCPRNTVHINLFLSFILRAVMCITKDHAFVAGIGLSSDMDRSGQDPLFLQNGTHWGCKTLITIFNYSLGANYSWLFVEGLYLHILIFFSMRTNPAGLVSYVLLGWGLPLLWIIPWAIVRHFYEDELCWNMHPTPGYFYIIKISQSAILLLSFGFFINIIRVLFIKLKATPEARKYRRLGRSTLVLIPLLGIHYIVFLALPDTIHGTTEVIRLYFELSLTSIQGFVVAVLYCFSNEEVRSELKKCWNTWRRDHHDSSGFDTSSWRRRSTTMPTAMSVVDGCQHAELLTPDEKGSIRSMNSKNQHSPETQSII